MTNNDTESIVLSNAAIQAARAMQTENVSYHEQSLRVYLDGKGCDGFYYGVAFDLPTAEDIHFFHDGIDVIVDPQTLLFVKGSSVDWIDDERGRGFLVENPNQRKFRGKFFKRESWQKLQKTEQNL